MAFVIAEIRFKHMNIDVFVLIFFLNFKLFIIKSKMRDKSHKTSVD